MCANREKKWVREGNGVNTGREVTRFVRLQIDGDRIVARTGKLDGPSPPASSAITARNVKETLANLC